LRYLLLSRMDGLRRDVVRWQNIAAGPSHDYVIFPWPGCAIALAPNAHMASGLRIVNAQTALHRCDNGFRFAHAPLALRTASLPAGIRAN